MVPVRQRGVHVRHPEDLVVRREGERRQPRLPLDRLRQGRQVGRLGLKAERGAGCRRAPAQAMRPVLPRY